MASFEEEWNKLLVDYCKKLIDSMRRQCQAIKGQGWPPKYKEKYSLNSVFFLYLNNVFHTFVNVILNKKRIFL